MRSLNEDMWEIPVRVPYPKGAAHLSVSCMGSGTEDLERSRRRRRTEEVDEEEEEGGGSMGGGRGLA